MEGEFEKPGVKSKFPIIIDYNLKTIVAIVSQLV